MATPKLGYKFLKVEVVDQYTTVFWCMRDDGTKVSLQRPQFKRLNKEGRIKNTKGILV